MSSIESTVPEAGRKPVRRAPMRGDRVEKEKARLDSLKLIPNIDRKTLCTQVLEMGFIQSYTDLFYLTHRPDPSSGKLNNFFLDGVIANIMMMFSFLSL